MLGSKFIHISKKGTRCEYNQATITQSLFNHFSMQYVCYCVVSIFEMLSVVCWVYVCISVMPSVFIFIVVQQAFFY